MGHEEGPTEAEVAAGLADPPWERWLGPWAFVGHPSLLDAAVAEISTLPAERLPPAVVRLHTLGRQTEERERGAWARTPWRDEPEADARVRRLWSGWASGRPFDHQPEWLALLTNPVTGSFRQALSTRPLPADVVRRALADLEEAVFYQLVGAGDAPSGFHELAVNVIESGPGGPVAALLGILSDRERAVVATCMNRRGHWPSTVARALPSLAGARERALHLRKPEGAPMADAWLDLHVVVRLVRTWTDAGLEDPDPDRDRAILVQNRGRARGRLRAVAACRTPAQLLPGLLALDHLADRTRAGARRWAWGWAWEALATGFAFDLGRPVIRPCATDATGPEPLDADEREAVRVWTLLAALRGRWDTVVRWCTTGEGDADGTWGRLLGEIPADLRDTDGGLAGVRSALSQDKDQLRGQLRPVLTAIAQLPTGRGLKQAFWDVANPVWNPAIRRPRSGFPSMRRHAQAWVRASEPPTGVPSSDMQEPEP